MTYQIWKYPLEIVDKQVLTMPAGVEILSVGKQGETVTLWAKVSLLPTHEVHKTPMESVTILIFGTGHALPKDIELALFIGTVLTSSDQLVWHIFRMMP